MNSKNGLIASLSCDFYDVALSDHEGLVLLGKKNQQPFAIFAKDLIASSTTSTPSQSDELQQSGIHNLSRIEWTVSISNDTLTFKSFNRSLSLQKRVHLDYLSDSLLLGYDSKIVKASLTHIGIDTELMIDPLHVDSFSISIAENQYSLSPNCCSKNATAEFSNDALRILPFRDFQNARVFLGLDNERTVESTIQLKNRKLFETSVSSLGSNISKIQIRSTEGEVVLTSGLPKHHTNRLAQNDSLFESAMENLLANSLDSAESLFLQLSLLSQYRSTSYFCLGLIELRRKQWHAAEIYFSESLLFNGVNPLAWWMKNWSARKQNNEGDSDLVNAHLLSPSEPCLRADSFFATGETTMLASLQSNPQNILNIAEWLLYAGQWEELYALLTESANQSPNSLYHLYLAFAFMQLPNKQMAVMEQIQFAEQSKLQLEPVRRSDQTVIQSLKSRFPNSDYLQSQTV